MSTIESKSFDSPDETRKFAGHGEAHVVELDGRTVIKSKFEPGWRWSNDIKPIAGTDSCQTRHFGYMISGEMKVVMDDGTERTLRPGELCVIEPGHDAEVVGPSACEFVDFGDVSNYAKSG
ncbi:MAG: cupin domain-containing protein [Thermoleophilaceae bacterium]